MTPPERSKRPGLSLKGQALRLLAQREHSRAELERKLRRKAQEAARREAAPPDGELRPRAPTVSAVTSADEMLPDLNAQIHAALDELGARGFQSDARTAASVLHSQGARYGSRRLQQTLQAKGLAPDLVRETLAAARDTEISRARRVWQKRFGEAPATPAERAKQMRFLAGRGFGGDTIRRVIGSAGFDADGLDDHDADADD